MKHAHIGLVALAAMAIAGCGGGSNNKTNGEGETDTPKPFNVVLPLGHGLAAGKIEIEADKSKTTGSGASLSCPASAGDDGCVVTIKVDDEALGTFTATSTGGEVKVTIPEDPEVTRLKRERDTAISQRNQQQQRADRAEGARDIALTERDTARTERDEQTKRADTAEQEADGKASQLRQNNARIMLDGLDSHDKSDQADQAGAGDPVVMARYRTSALVTTNPRFSAPKVTTPGAPGKWFRTSITSRDFDHIDRLDVYSDVEAPKQIPFRDSVYQDGTAGDDISDTVGDLTVTEPYHPEEAATNAEVIDSKGEVAGSLRIPNNGRVSGVVSSAFPKSGGSVKTFTVKDRGLTKTEIDTNKDTFANAADDAARDALTFDKDGFPKENYTGPRRARDEERYPNRWTYESPSSRLAGASGTFTCSHEADTQPAANGCRVTNQNAHFSFFGPWVFTPDKNARVQVDDTEYMYFGWWARQTNPNDIDGAWTFRTFHGSATGGNRSTEAEIARLSGTATYKGVAAGYYSFFAPLDSSSDYGEFTATATLTANFTETDDDSLGGDETVSGTIDNFTTRNGNRVNRPDWTVTLKQTDIIGTRTGNFGGGAGGAGVEAMRNLTANQGPVSWKIKDEAVSAPDSGQWEAAFYSNLPANKRGGDDPAVNQEDATPAGIAGTFEAEYHAVGKMVGAFGAHKQ